MTTNQVIELIARSFEEGDFFIPEDEYGNIDSEELCTAIAHRIRVLSDYFDPVKE